MGTSHRQAPVKQVVREIQEGLKNYFSLPADYQVVLGNGGATMLWDMIGLGLVEQASQHFTCGEFSEKWHHAHSLIPWIKTSQEKVNYGEGIRPYEVAGCDMVCTTLNETSTGVQNTFLPAVISPDVLWAMDATSGAGQIPVDIKRVDLYYFSPQKVWASDGGLFVAFLSPKAQERIRKVASDKSRYIPESFKLIHALELGLNHQTYNTPALATLFLLNEQVKLLNQLGESAVAKQAAAKAQWLYDWAEKRPYLSAFVTDPTYRSQAVATIDVAPRYSVPDLTSMLRRQQVAVDIDGYRKLGRNQLRIAFFHNISLEDLMKLTQAIDLAIETNS